MADENNIQMKLLSVDEVRFMMSSDAIDESTNPENIKIGFSNGIDPDVERDRFSMIFGVRYMVDNELILESVYRFTFEVVDLVRFVTFNQDQSITINHLMPHFLSVAVGTMRGILVAKTAGTAFTLYPLPIIDINQLNENLSSARK